MIRIRLIAEPRNGNNTQHIISNISGDFLGILAKINDGYMFNGLDWIINAGIKEGEQIKTILYFDENRTFEYCLERINMLVEKYINRFFEEEE